MIFTSKVIIVNCSWCNLYLVDILCPWEDKVTSWSVKKSRIPKTAVKRIRKLHLKVAEGSVKSRQASSNLRD